MGINEIDTDTLFNQKAGMLLSTAFLKTLRELLEHESGLILYRDEECNTSIRGEYTKAVELPSPRDRSKLTKIEPYLKVSIRSKAPSNKKSPVVKSPKKRK